MSYNIIKENTLNNRVNLIEGIALIETKYLNYNRDKLEDSISKSKYSVQMIEKSIDNILNMKEILKIIIFDALIGNSDRHHSNWGIIASREHLNLNGQPNITFKYTLSPLYDNGSSLCSYVNDEDILTILNDKVRFEALINTKSKSAIGWENERPIRHFNLIEKLKENYYEDTKDFVRKIKENINEENINKILNLFDDKIISKNMKRLLLRFLIERKNRIVNIYEMKDGENNE